MVQLITAIQEVFNTPPIPFNPELQTLKGWAMYCLRDRGFKVIYAQNADFAIEPRNGNKLYFKVTEDAEDLDPSVGWIVRERGTDHIQVIAPQP